ncbi:MAG: type IV toxin-antitoxin system AbiEi family antitoxin [Pseudomonadota bacterium]
MKRSVYSKTATPEEVDLLKSLKEAFPQGSFTMRELKTEWGDNWNSGKRRTLDRLRNKGWVILLEKGKYGFGELVSSDVMNSFVIGTRLVSPSAIAYQSALNHYGWTEQISNVVFVQTTKRKTAKLVQNVRYQFVTVADKKFFGIANEWSGPAKYQITDPEKTILDCFDLPEYAGGFAEIVKSFYAARKDLDKEKLWQYTERLNNQTVMKRIGYVSELYGLEDFAEFRKKALSRLTKTSSILDPLSAQTGRIVYKWRLLLNVSDEALRSMGQGAY